MHQDSKRYTSTYLIVRSLLPSGLEGMVCVCIGLLMVIVHVVLLSMALGTLFPTFLDGQWGIFYTNDIVQPLLTLSSSLTFSNILNLSLWGLLGLAVYFVFEVAVDFYKDWREEEADIQIAGTQIIHHPARKSFLTKVFWRVGVLFVSLLTLVAFAEPVLTHLFIRDDKLVLGEVPLSTAATKIALEIVGWALISHATVVFGRLFLMRTRLFGDPDIT